jgi:hypothetical protein
MKILCLLVILANIFLLLSEYRKGGGMAHKTKPEQHSGYGKEQILLLHELKKAPQSSSPRPNQETSLNAPGPVNDIKETLRNKENDDTANKVEIP